jgi:hypothetical protein
MTDTTTEWAIIARIVHNTDRAQIAALGELS